MIRMKNINLYQNYLIFVIVICLILPVISAEIQTLGTFIKSSDVELKQVGDGYTSCNITSVTLQGINSTTLIEDVAMIKRGNEYNYTLISNYTGSLGKYVVNGICDDDVWAYDFYITENGRAEPEGIVIVVFTGVFLVVLMFATVSLLKMIGHWVDLEVDIIDASLAMSLYFVVLALYYLSKYYLGNILINDMLFIAVGVGGFTHVIVPITAFVTSLIFNPFRKGANNG